MTEESTKKKDLFEAMIEIHRKWRGMEPEEFKSYLRKMAGFALSRKLLTKKDEPLVTKKKLTVADCMDLAMNVELWLPFHPEAVEEVEYFSDEAVAERKRQRQEATKANG